MSADRSYDTLTLYRRLLSHARPCLGYVAAAFAASLLAMPLALLVPLPLKVAVDSALGAEPLPRFLDAVVPDYVAPGDAKMMGVVAVLVLAVATLSLLQQIATRLLSTYAGEKLVLSLRATLFRHVQRLSLSYHDTRGATDSAYRIQHDTPAIEWIVLEGTIPFVTAIVTLCGMLYVTARISVAVALVAMTVSPIFLVLHWIYSHRLRRRWKDAKEIDSSALSVVQEVLVSLRLVKIFQREEDEEQRFAHHARRGSVAKLRAVLSESLLSLLIGLTTAGGTAAVLFIGVRSVRNGQLSVGDLLLVLGYVTQIYAPLKVIGKQLGAQQRSLASLERVFAVLDEKPEVPEAPNPRPLRRARGAICYRNVSFSYDGERNVLRQVSFELPPGTRVGIVGKTGSGKSTLINLLVRFYDPTAGEILLDEIRIPEYRLTDLRNQFAIATQAPLLFSTTIGENIAYGRRGASREQVIEAARLANADEFIRQLPEGYDTQVGEQGVCLSGGERQRIALARAFLKDAPILILDEPTSSVDVKTEAAIIEAMQRLMRGRTCFIVAHRLTTLEGCDRIMKLDAGRLTEVATLALAGATA